eukprot:TRINITY_DN2343_c0_g1_i1.p1 TRINITY_DN2343_c0_g1~~TRINITY_DN2343_c0_g1_i1.p1  ORF type:complete len:464 (+),score=111.39 TRINITY_DN2343_c0_g1_i1:67-1458(+)
MTDVAAFSHSESPPRAGSTPLRSRSAGRRGDDCSSASLQSSAQAADLMHAFAPSLAPGRGLQPVCSDMAYPSEADVMMMMASEPKEPPKREPGVWVHPKLRQLREWHKVRCKQCGIDVAFPWLGITQVSCPSCSQINDSTFAVIGETPSANMVAKAMADEQRLGLLRHSQFAQELRAKEFARKFQWIVKRGDAIEATCCGKPRRYGNVKLYLRDRLMLPPSSAFFIIPILIAGPPYLVGVTSIFASWALMQYVVHTLVLGGMFCLLVAHMTDPGILPKQPPHPEMPDKEEEVNGVPTPIKWCRTCNLYRPPRASHCGTCNVCVDRFDHHCHVTGTCVGRRNFLPFSLFVFCITAADCIVFLGSLAYFFWWKQPKGAPVALPAVMLVWTLICAVMMCSMMLGLFTMAIAGLTTREFMQRKYPIIGHPFDRGSALRNACAMWFEDRGPSLLSADALAAAEQESAV